MYHSGVPGVFKQWVDCICRHSQAFHYTQTGPKGPAKLKQACLVTASGGTEIGAAGDYASRYLAQVCRFLSAQDVQHTAVCGSKGSPEAVLADAKAQIDALLG